MLAPSAQAALPDYYHILSAVPAAQVFQKTDHSLAIVSLVLPADVQPPVGCHRGDHAHMFLACLLLDYRGLAPGCPSAAHQREQIKP